MSKAFAGLLLLPDSSLIEQFKMFGISKDDMRIDDVLILMNLFVLPYKAVVLRLAESGLITEQELLVDSREASDKAYLKKMERHFANENEVSI